jgi:rhodanese-related sulfurtransferase
MYDDGASFVAAKAQALARRYGYSDVHVLEGGTRAWEEAGFSLFTGVNVPSKTFGELVEHAEAVPLITAGELHDRLAAKEDVVVIDGRPIDEYRKMNIPGSLCCPNGELVYRIGEIIRSPETTVVINCAGRTRSIMGAATLRRFGCANRVVALENGTMGWRLAGFELEHGSDRLYPLPPHGVRLEEIRREAADLAGSFGVSKADAETVVRWLGENNRTTYLLDIRTPEEFGQGSAPGAVSAPGGQLLQATDQWLGVRNARVVLLDDEEVRAPVIASWLSQLGWETHVLEGGLAAAASLPADPGLNSIATMLAEQPPVGPQDLVAPGSDVVLVDVRHSSEYRRCHLQGAVWATRARLDNVLGRIGSCPALVIADNGTLGRAFAAEIAKAGCKVVGLHVGNPDLWRRFGLALASTPDIPSDADCIDYLFFVHDRHAGNLDAARQYLAWEKGLVAKLDKQELAGYRLRLPRA